MNVRRWSLGLALLACSAMPAGVSWADDDPQGTTESFSRGCGAYSVGIAVGRISGSPPRFADVESVVDPDGDGVCSMLDITEGLASHGLVGKPVVLDPEQPLPGMSILWLREPSSLPEPNHFAVVEPISDDAVLVYMPPLGARQRSMAELRSQWDGHAVLVGGAAESGRWPAAWLAVLAGLGTFGLGWLGVWTAKRR